MKTTLYITALIIIFYLGPVYSQDLKMGVLGGINLANLDSEERDSKSVIAMSAGAVVDIPLNENLYLCFQPMYLQKGAKEEEIEGEITTTSQSNLAYLEVPMYLKIFLTSTDTRPYFFFGPTLGYLFSATLNITSPGINFDVNTKELSESLDYGLIVGAGVEFAVGQNFVFLDCRYHYGLADIFKGGRLVILGVGEQLPDEEVKTKGIQIFLGISFPLSY